MKKALVIGAAGFVGDYLSERLLQDGYDVYATKLQNEVYSRDNVAVFNLNILKINEISEILNTICPDIIFHLAAQSSVALSWKNPALTVDINIKGTLNLLESIRKSKLSLKTILIGSSEEYGFSFTECCPITEDACPKPTNIYALTKATQNMLGAIYAKAYNMDIVMVRAFNHIGPRQTEQFVVSDFCKQVAEIEKNLKEPCIYVGNLSAKRDFTDVRDIVNAYSIIAKSGQSGETYNIGSGKAVSIQDILNLILNLSTVNIKVVEDNKKLRPSDIPIAEADVQKITSLGWKPSIDINQSLNDIINYWRKRV